MAGISPGVRSPLAVLAILCAGYAVSFFHRACPAVPSVVLMQDFSLDAASFSLISSSTMPGCALTRIPSGMLADIIGGRRTMALYQVFAGLSFMMAKRRIICALYQVLAGLLNMAFTLCSGLASAVACRFLPGLTLTANIPARKILAARAFPG